MFRLTTLTLTVAASLSACGGGGGDVSNGSTVSSAGATATGAVDAVGSTTATNNTGTTGSSAAANGGTGTGTGTGIEAGNTASVAASATDCMITDDDVARILQPYQVSETIYGQDGVTPTLTSETSYVTTAGATFKGFVGLYRQTISSTDRIYLNGIPTSSTARGVSSDYFGVTDTAILDYGTDHGRAGTRTHSPPVSIPRRPSLNVAYKNTYVAVTEGSPIAEENISFAMTLFRTLVSIEQITVPAGTFQACKMLSVGIVENGPVKGTTNQTTEWSVANGPYKGLPLKLIGETFDASGRSLSRSTNITTALRLGN